MSAARGEAERRHQQLDEIQLAMAQAATAAAAARQQLPDDPQLAELHVALQAKAEAVAALAAQSREQWRASMASEQAAVNALQSAQQELTRLAAERPNRQALVEQTEQQLAAVQANCARLESDSNLAESQLTDFWSRNFAPRRSNR